MMNEKQGKGSDLPRPTGRLSGRQGGSAGMSPQPAPARKKKPSPPPQRTAKPKPTGDAPDAYVPSKLYEDDYSYDEEPSARKPKSKPPAKRKKKRGLFRRVVRLVLTLVVAVFLLYSAASLLVIARMGKTPTVERNVTTGTIARSYTRSILLIGTDARDPEAERGRSDTMMLVTINARTRQISLTSFMRDSYVTIPGYGDNKLNAAYSFGGADLLLDTIEQNFDVRIDDYLCVTFTGFARLIDAFGGVKMTLDEAEAEELNHILQNEVNELMGDAPDADLLSGAGEYTLSGKQALSYARIRYVGNADFERTSRQRRVMEQLMQSAKTHLLTAMPALVTSAVPQMTTNMSVGDLYLLSLRAPFLIGYDMHQQQIPADGTWSSVTMSDGQSALQMDFSANRAIIEGAYAQTRQVEE